MTMTNDIFKLLLAGAAGLLLGTFFFGGLWLTVRNLAASRHPAFRIFVSSLLRMAMALAGFYWVSGGHWERLAVCLAGFILARQAVAWLTGERTAQADSKTGRSEHAP